MPDVILVGSGASAVAAALELTDRGVNPLVLDVGVRAPAGTNRRGTGNLYDYKATHDSFSLTIGERYQGLANLIGTRHVPVKLTTPNAEYVTQGADTWSPVDAEGFHAIQSFALGGLANAWGAGLYRFTRADLDGFPIGQEDLDPYFDRLTSFIGISGADDDLSPFFGSARDLLPPVRLSHNIGRLYDRYQRRKRTLPRAFHLGRARIAALTREHGGRPPVAYDNFEFWQEHPALYTPGSTMQQLIADGRVTYRGNVLVQSFAENADGVTVRAIDLSTDSALEFRCRHLLLAAGAINTAKIVLRSFDDHRTELPLLENTAVQVPFVLPRSLGRPLDTTAFGLVQLNLVWESDTFDALCQGSLMEITSPLRAEFFASLPYAARDNLGLMRHLLPCMLVMQLYLPDDGARPARLSLQENSRLRIVGHPNTLDVGKAGPLFGFMRKLGAWTHPRLAVRVSTGHAIHYAGTLPMAHSPGRYQCAPDGLLHSTRAVYVCDSASFPRLPAKNMSFGMMANAMRIAATVAARCAGVR